MRCCRPYYNHIRRARERAAFVEAVVPLVVFERDEWACHICGDPVDRLLSYPDPRCATVDHVIPLSKGGLHAYANCRTAHMLCNSIKQARVKYPTRVVGAVPDTGGGRHGRIRTGSEGEVASGQGQSGPGARSAH
ncbi:HNH endonuclease [Embleya sp. NPDC056575]